MPDVHAGKGATVGSVIPTKGAIIPAAVGVDIGCGMNAIRLSINANDLPEYMRAIRSAIEEAIPVGYNMHKYDRARESTIRAYRVGWTALYGSIKRFIRCRRNPIKHGYGKLEP